MSNEYIIKNDATGLFQFITDATDYRQLINFVELAKLKEEIDALYADEQSRLLQESLSGDYICDGCTI